MQAISSNSSYRLKFGAVYSTNPAGGLKHNTYGYFLVNSKTQPLWITDPERKEIVDSLGNIKKAEISLACSKGTITDLEKVQKSHADLEARLISLAKPFPKS